MIKPLLIAAATSFVVGVSVAAATASGSEAGNQPPVATRAVEIPAAFERPPTPADLAALRHPEVREAIDVLTSDDPGVPEAWNPGAAGDLRVLLSGLGPSNRLVFAFKTERGRLCAGLSGFTSGCLSALPASESISLTVGDPDGEGMGEGAIVWGVANRDVSTVSVVVGGRALSARVGSGAYFFQAPTGVRMAELERIVVRLRSGAVESSALPTGPRLPVSFGG